MQRDFFAGRQRSFPKIFVILRDHVMAMRPILRITPHVNATLPGARSDTSPPEKVLPPNNRSADVVGPPIRHPPILFGRDRIRIEALEVEARIDKAGLTRRKKGMRND
jgi:hypothetical protein